jgi:Tol biopolymer transport system component
VSFTLLAATLCACAQESGPVSGGDGDLFLPPFDLVFDAVASGEGEASRELFIMRLDGSGLRRLTDNGSRDANPSISPDGGLLAFERTVIDTLGLPSREIFCLDLHTGRDPRWFPDGRHLVFSSDRAGGGVFLVDTSSTIPTQLLADAIDPVVSPDGTRIAFVRSWNDAGVIKLAVHEADTLGGPARRITDGGSNTTPDPSGLLGDKNPDYLPGGLTLVFDRLIDPFGPAGDADWNLFAIGTNGSGERPLTSRPYVEIFPRVSPQGDEVVFTALSSAFGLRIGLVDDQGASLFFLETGALLPSRASWNRP